MFDLGLDFNNAHVQPNGAYHYHGVPTSLLGEQGEHSKLIGFAADGFPIYALEGYSDPLNPASDIITLNSSYTLKSGARQAGEPAGNYDGTYTNDFVFDAGSGDLDECNGRETVTPEYPDGTYAYFVTESFPYIGRCVKGTPDQSFNKGGGAQGGIPDQGQRPPRPPR